MTTLAKARPLVARIGRVDMVWIAVAAIVGAIWLVAPEQGRAVVWFTLDNLWQILPYLVVSIGLAAAAQAAGADHMVSHAFVGRPYRMIVVAAAFGALSPFCSCGVVPLIAALLAMGVPLAPVMAFWLASPVIDPSMFVLTAAVVGLPFAVAKMLAAISIGLFGGLIVHGLNGRGLIGEPLRQGIGNGGCAGSKVRAPKPVVWRFWTEAARRDKFRHDAAANTVFLGKWLTLAFVLESLMIAYVPASLVVQAVGGDGVGSLVTATLVGIPAYLNGYAALPLVAGLMEQGMAPGAALAFLVAGGITSIPAAMAVFAVARAPVFAAYVGLALVGSLTAGLVYAHAIPIMAFVP